MCASQRHSDKQQLRPAPNIRYRTNELGIIQLGRRNVARSPTFVPPTRTPLGRSFADTDPFQDVDIWSLLSQDKDVHNRRLTTRRWVSSGGPIKISWTNRRPSIACDWTTFVPRSLRIFTENLWGFCFNIFADRWRWFGWAGTPFHFEKINFLKIFSSDVPRNVRGTFL